MPLDTDGLKSDLQAIAENPPATLLAAAQQWAQAVVFYAGSVVPASTTVSAAGAVLQDALADDPDDEDDPWTGAFTEEFAAPDMETAFAEFAFAVAQGMAPAFAGSPPAGPVGFAGLFAVKRPSASEAADDVGSAIDAWMKSGTAVPSVGGATVLWG